MKIKGVSFSKYNLNLTYYELIKLDLITYLFVNLIMDEKIDKESSVGECLVKLEISEELFYLFDNCYYKLVDNGVILDLGVNSVKDVKLKDIVISNRFINCFKNNYNVIRKDSVSKSFCYDYLNNKIVLETNVYDDSNIVCFRVDNRVALLEDIVNSNSEKLFNEKGLYMIDRVSVDPYYFEFSLDYVNDLLVCKDNKEVIYKALNENSLFVNDNKIKGEYISNNIYFNIYYSDLDLNIGDYRFCFSKDKEFEVIDNVIYVGYLFKGDIIDLNNKIKYDLGISYLEDNSKVSVCNKEKVNIKEFKLYLNNNKDKFKVNINKIIESI